MRLHNRCIAVTINNMESYTSLDIYQSVDAEEPSNSNPSDHSKQAAKGRSRSIRLGCMMIPYALHGLLGGVLTTSMVDLQVLLNCSIGQLGLCLALGQVGKLIGALLGGRMMEAIRKYVDIWIGIATILEGLLCFSLPWATLLSVFGTLVVVHSFTMGFATVLCASLTIGEWGADSPVPMNALQMAVSFGLLAGSAMTAPFLSTQEQNSTVINPANSSLSMDYRTFHMENILTAENSSLIQEKTSIYYPFGIVAIGQGIAGIIFICLYCRVLTASTAGPVSCSSDQGFTTPTTLQSRRGVKIMIAVTLFVMYVAAVTKENIVTGFVFYMAVSSLHVPEQRAALLNTVSNACWAGGRLLGTVISKFIRIQILLFSVVVMDTILAILLALFGFNSDVIYWSMVCVFHLCSGPCQACIIVWLDRYVAVDSTLMSVVLVAEAVAGFIIFYIGGFLLENYGSVAIFVVSAAAACLLLLVLTLSQWVLLKGGDRFGRESPRVTTIEPGSETDPLLSRQS